MDGKVQFEREAGTDEVDEDLHLQAIYAPSTSTWQTHTVPTGQRPRSSSGPRLIETRAMPSAP